jgi:Transposase DDE domain
MKHTPIVQDPSSQASTTQQEQIILVFQEMLADAAPLPPAGTKRKPGRPKTLSTQQLWLALLVGIFQSSGGFRDIWRFLTVESLGTFPALRMTYEGVRKRLVSLGCGALQELYEHIRQVLAQRDRPASRSALPLASFASEIVALDETTLDKLKRLTSDLKDIPDGDPHVLAGKLAGVFDLRRQQWRCLQLRTDVLAACNTGVLMLLEELPRASLILADLGYFGFAWFDYLTNAGYYYLSRLRENGTYLVEHVSYEDKEHHVLDAIVWLGAYRADKAAHAVRLVQFELRGVVHQYITNVLDPLQLPILEIAQLYARRWDIELQFKLLKCELGLHIWWAAKQELVEIQLWIALILAQVLCSLRFDIAEQANVDLFDVSLPLLMKVLERIKASSQPLLQKIVEHGRDWGIIRPNRRKEIRVPALTPNGYRPLPKNTILLQKPRYAKRNPHPRKEAFLPRYQDKFLIDIP